PTGSAPAARARAASSSRVSWPEPSTSPASTARSGTAGRHFADSGDSDPMRSVMGAAYEPVRGREQKKLETHLVLREAPLSPDQPGSVSGLHENSRGGRTETWPVHRRCVTYGRIRP